jgi:hypothetical protein
MKKMSVKLPETQLTDYHFVVYKNYRQFQVWLAAKMEGRPDFKFFVSDKKLVNETQVYYGIPEQDAILRANGVELKSVTFLGGMELYSPSIIAGLKTRMR